MYSLLSNITNYISLFSLLQNVSNSILVDGFSSPALRIMVHQQFTRYVGPESAFTCCFLKVAFE